MKAFIDQWKSGKTGGLCSRRAKVLVLNQGLFGLEPVWQIDHAI